MLEASLLNAAETGEQPANPAATRVAPKNGPKVRRTIRVRQSAPPPAPASPAQDVSVNNAGATNNVNVRPQVVVAVPQPANQQQQPEQQRQPVPQEIQVVTDSNEPLLNALPLMQPPVTAPDQEPLKQVEVAPGMAPQLMQPAQLSEPSLVMAPMNQIDEPIQHDIQEPKSEGPLVPNPASNDVHSLNDPGNTRNVVLSNVGNSELVHLDGVGNSKVTTISNVGNSDSNLEQQARTCDHPSHNAPSVHHHYYGQTDSNINPPPQMASQPSAGSPFVQVNINENGERRELAASGPRGGLVSYEAKDALSLVSSGELGLQAAPLVQGQGQGVQLMLVQPVPAEQSPAASALLVHPMPVAPAAMPYLPAPFVPLEMPPPAPYFTPPAPLPYVMVPVPWPAFAPPEPKEREHKVRREKRIKLPRARPAKVEAPSLSPPMAHEEKPKDAWPFPSLRRFEATTPPPTTTPKPEEEEEEIEWETVRIPKRRTKKPLLP